MAYSELAELQAVHAQTMDLLEKVRDYLLRLPPVPVTKDVCREIDRHIQSPRTLTQTVAARRTVRDSEVLHGTCYSSGGVPLLFIDIRGHSAKLSTGIPKAAAAQAQYYDMLFKTLRRTTTIKLRPGERPPPIPSLMELDDPDPAE